MQIKVVRVNHFSTMHFCVIDFFKPNTKRKVHLVILLMIHLHMRSISIHRFFTHIGDLIAALEKWG